MFSRTTSELLVYHMTQQRKDLLTNEEVRRIARSVRFSLLGQAIWNELQPAFKDVNLYVVADTESRWLSR